MGIGSVKLSLLVGTLSVVRHLPKLRRKFILIVTLDALSYSNNIDNGTMRVINGSLVASKAIIVNILYVLHDLILDSNGVASVVQSLDSTMLWHGRLRHISEKGLSTLAKLGVFCSKHLGDINFCEHYVFGKKIRVKFTKGNQIIQNVLDYM